MPNNCRSFFLRSVAYVFGGFTYSIVYPLKLNHAVPLTINRPHGRSRRDRDADSFHIRHCHTGITITHFYALRGPGWAGCGVCDCISPDTKHAQMTHLTRTAARNAEHAFTTVITYNTCLACRVASGARLGLTPAVAGMQRACNRYLRRQQGSEVAVRASGSALT